MTKTVKFATRALFIKGRILIKIRDSYQNKERKIDVEKVATLVFGGEDNCKLLENGLVQEGTAYLQGLQRQKTFANRFYNVCLPRKLVSIKTIKLAKAEVEQYLGKKIDLAGLKRLCFQNPAIEVNFYDCEVAILKIKFAGDAAYLTCAFVEEIVLGTLKDCFAKAHIVRYRIEPNFADEVSEMKIN
jgi:hypothetical protein